MCSFLGAHSKARALLLQAILLDLHAAFLLGSLL